MADMGRGIKEKIHWKKGDDMNKEDMNIESYEGGDAFYTGTDEEYEEFLKNADVKMSDEEAEPVENTQKINLNETINIQSVIDKFRKKASGIKDTVAGKVDEFKSKKEVESAIEKAEEIKENIEGKIKDTIEESGIRDMVKGGADKLDEFKEGVGAISDMNNKFTDISADIGSLSRKITELSDRLSVLEIEGSQRGKDSAQSFTDIKREIGEISGAAAEIKQAVNSVSKLNDSVFDLKNAQLNTKNAVSDIELSITRLKKKCVMGVTIISVLSAIIIVLEIILMLS